MIAHLWRLAEEPGRDCMSQKENLLSRRTNNAADCKTASDQYCEPTYVNICLAHLLHLVRIGKGQSLESQLHTRHQPRLKRRAHLERINGEVVEGQELLINLGGMRRRESVVDVLVGIRHSEI